MSRSLTAFARPTKRSRRFTGPDLPHAKEVYTIHFDDLRLLSSLFVRNAAAAKVIVELDMMSLFGQQLDCEN